MHRAKIDMNNLWEKLALPSPRMQIIIKIFDPNFNKVNSITGMFIIAYNFFYSMNLSYQIQ